MRYRYLKFHHAIFMAAEHNFRFVNIYGNEIFYDKDNGVFKAADILERDSVGSHVVANGRTIKCDEDIYVHNECWRLFAPKVGDLWRDDLSGSHIAIDDEHRLSAFITMLQMWPDKYSLITRNGTPYIHPEIEKAS